MEDFDIVKIVYAMYLVLQKPKENFDDLDALKQKFVSTLSKKQAEAFGELQKLCAEKQDLVNKGLIRFVINLIKNLV